MEGEASSQREGRESPQSIKAEELLRLQISRYWFIAKGVTGKEWIERVEDEWMRGGAFSGAACSCRILGIFTIVIVRGRRQQRRCIFFVSCERGHTSTLSTGF